MNVLVFVILFVCDIRTGLLADDMDIALMLKKSGKPVVPCINKADKIGDLPAEFYDFYQLGIGDPIGISSLNMLNLGDLLDVVFDLIAEVYDIVMASGIQIVVFLSGSLPNVLNVA